MEPSGRGRHLKVPFFVRLRPPSRRQSGGTRRSRDAQQEGIVNVYSEATHGREFLDRAQDGLSADQIARATEIGRRLTIKEALDLARPQHLAAA